MKTSLVKKSQALIATLVLLLHLYADLSAAEVEVRPGDIIGPHNWQKVEGMVGENLLNRIKAGYTLKIKEPSSRKFPREYLLATEENSGRVTLGSDGQLLNYVSGIPFPKITPADPHAGLKLAWNFFRRWVGDDFKDGGGTATGKASSFTIERDGAERRSDVIRHEIKTRGRVTLDPRPVLPGYEHIDWMVIRADEYPRDTAGTTTLETRYVDPSRDDDLYIYVPSIRRVRRAPPTQRCATLAPTEFNYDDINSFNGKITNFKYRMLGQKRMLGNFSQKTIPFERKSGDYLPTKEDWEIVDTYVLEITPKNPDYCYPKKILYIDQLTNNAIWVIVLDAEGVLWKEQFNFFTPTKLSDGQEVISTASPVIVNLKNGRATIFTSIRAYNLNYPPTFFTLATLQQVLRGGALR
jgi:hypothetical protein